MHYLSNEEEQLYSIFRRRILEELNPDKTATSESNKKDRLSGTKKKMKRWVRTFATELADTDSSGYYKNGQNLFDIIICYEKDWKLIRTLVCHTYGVNKVADIPDKYIKEANELANKIMVDIWRNNKMFVCDEFGIDESELENNFETEF